MKKSAKNTFEELKEAIKTGELRPFYIFYGEESYLKEYSIGAIRKKIVEGGMESFNLTVLEGNAVTLDSLSDAIMSYPAFAEKKLVLLRDFDILKPPASMQEGILALLSELPDYLCLIASYDTIPFGHGKLSSAGESIRKLASVINFEKSGTAELINWIKRRFSALGKSIETGDAEYLIFLSGGLMNQLIHEIEKIASYSKSKTIRREDIDAVATKMLDAQIYTMTEHIVTGNVDKAIQTLRELIMMKYEPVLLSGAITRQMLRLYSAKLIKREGRQLSDLMKLWGMKSSYPAEKLLTACSSFTLSALDKSLSLCAKSDLSLKSTAFDKANILEMLLLDIASIRRAAI